MQYHSLPFVVAVVWAICLGGIIRPSDGAPATAPSGEQWGTVLQVWNAAQLPRVRSLQLTVAESSLDDATKKRISDALRDYEANLRKLIHQARTEPTKAADVAGRMRTFQSQQAPAIRKLFTDEQYQTMGQSNRSIEIELAALGSDPDRVGVILDEKFHLTAGQKAKITPAISRMAKELHSAVAALDQPDPARRVDAVMTKMDELVLLAVETRSQIRSALTPEQFSEFERSLRGERTSGGKVEEQPATSPTTAPAKR